MSTGDKRYLGDVFINQENYERQKQFFRDVIDSYQYKYGGTFDASTLQGMVPNDFATKEQGEKADNALISPLRLGRKEIINIDDAQYIYTDAVLLDDEDNRLTAIEWYQNLTNGDVTDALIAIYNQVTAIQEALDENKLNRDEFSEFYEDDYVPLKNDISQVFEEFVDQDGETVKKLNAQLINGLRFILITQSAYNQLSNEEKNYWRNIYIIKDPEAIPPEYVDPMTWELTDGYSFRVNDGGLQVNNGLSSEWSTICTLDELIAGSNFNNIILEFLESAEYNIPPENVISAIEDLSNTDVDADWENYPFLSSSLHDDFIKTITINNDSTNVHETVGPVTNFKTVDLDIDAFLQSSSNTINNLQTTLNSIENDVNTIEENIGNVDIQDLSDDLTNARNQISSTINPNISTLQTNMGTHDSRIGSIERSLQSINTQISNIRQEMNNREKFDILIFNKYNSKIGMTGEIFGFENAGSVFLKRQGMCHAYFYMVSGSTFTYNTTSGMPNYIKISSAKLPDAFCPYSDSVFIPVSTWNGIKIGVIKITSGDIYYANTAPNQTAGFNIIASWSYICKDFQGQVNSTYQTYDANR